MRAAYFTGMNRTEKEDLIRRLEQRFVPGNSGAGNGREHVHNTLEGMVDAGACRFGVCSDQPERAGFSACDLAPPLARMIDHTALKPETTEAQIRELCREARKYCFASVCINPSFVRLAAELLRGSPVAVCTVIGFPLGATTSAGKEKEAELAVLDGATEIDMVLNIGMLKGGQYDYVESDIRGVVTAGKQTGRGPERSVITKVILETALLTDEEKVIASILAQNAGADFVKTSTGFSTGGATASDVALMRSVVGPEMGVKASGGVRTKEDAETMIAHGATRIGASASVAILHGLSGSKGY